MKKKMLMLALLAFAIAVAAQDSKPQLRLADFKDALNEGQAANILAMYGKDAWPKDNNGRKYCALVRVSFENMTLLQMRELVFNFSASSGLRDTKDLLETEGIQEMWLFVTPGKTYIDATLTGYGTSNRINVELAERGVYRLRLVNDKTETVVVNTYVKNSRMRLDLGDLKTADSNGSATFAGQKLGSRRLSVYDSNGALLKDTSIVVTEGHGPYVVDVRKRKRIRFVSDPAGAIVYLDGQKVGMANDYIDISVPFGSHSVRAELSEKEFDELPFTVDEASQEEYKLEPVKKMTFTAAAVFEGNPTEADLYIDGKRQGEQAQQAYVVTRPVGHTYKFVMSNYNGSAKRKMKVTADMNPEQIFELKPRNTFVWPWERDYDADPVGVSVSYVQKQLSTKGNGEKLKDNGVWDDGVDKWLSGLQVGFHFQPCFSFGLGLYSGLFYEIYFSSNDNYDYDSFVEHCLYLPVHAYYRLPFANKVALSVHGGMGFSYSVHGAYSDDDGIAEDYTDFYGEDYYPKRFNMALEIGLGLRLGPVQLNFQYSKGINDHETYSVLGDYKTTQNKLTFGASYVISSGY